MADMFEGYGNAAVNRMIDDAGSSGTMDRDAEKERMATEYYESQAASQPELVKKYEDRRGK